MNFPRAIVAGAIGWALSLFLAAPNFRILGDSITYPQRYEVFARQVADPFARGGGGVWDGDFMAFRILVPAIAHAAGVPPWIAVGLIWLAGLLTLSLIFAWLERHTSRRTAWLTTLGLGLTPLIQGSHIYVGYPDSVGWLIAAGLIVWPSPPLWALGTIAMMFNDERALLALPLALALAATLYDRRHDRPAVIRMTAIVAAWVGVGLTAAVAGRWLIASGTLGGAPLAEGLLPIGAGFNTIMWAHAAGLVLAFKAYWVLPGWAATIAARDRGAGLYWVAVAVSAIVAIVLSARVFDYWRSLAVLFPLVLISVRVLHDARAAMLGRWLPILTLVMVLTPQLEQMNTRIRWLRPLPLAIYEWQTGKSLAEAIRGLAYNRIPTSKVAANPGPAGVRLSINSGPPRRWMPSRSFRVERRPFAAYGPAANTWSVIASSKYHYDVNSPARPAAALLRILQWM